MGQLATTDIIVFLIYFVLVSGYGYWIYRHKKAVQKMGWVFFFTSILIIIVSLLDAKGRLHIHALQVDKNMYKVTPGKMAMIIIILGIIVALYIRFW